MIGWNGGTVFSHEIGKMSTLVKAALAETIDFRWIEMIAAFVFVPCFLNIKGSPTHQASQPAG
jgi:hypothetical protein